MSDRCSSWILGAELPGSRQRPASPGDEPSWSVITLRKAGLGSGTFAAHVSDCRQRGSPQANCTIAADNDPYQSKPPVVVIQEQVKSNLIWSCALISSTRQNTVHIYLYQSQFGGCFQHLTVPMLAMENMLTYMIQQRTPSY